MIEAGWFSLPVAQTLPSEQTVEQPAQRPGTCRPARGLIGGRGHLRDRVVEGIFDKRVVQWLEQQPPLPAHAALGVTVGSRGPSIALRHTRCGSDADPLLVCRACREAIELSEVLPTPGPGASEWVHQHLPQLADGAFVGRDRAPVAPTKDS